MNRLLLSSAALLWAAGMPAAAQQVQSLSDSAPIIQALPDITKEPPAPIDTFVEGQASGQLLASDLIGLTLYDTKQTAVGAISDVVIDEGGSLSLVVVDVGAYLNSPKRVAFPFDSLAFQKAGDEYRIVAEIDRPALEAAPAFKSLANQMSQDDGQSLTADEAKAKTVEDQNKVK